MFTFTGEKDTTLRWWTYQIWIKLHKLLKLKVPLPKAIMNHKFSMVYAKNLPKVILSIIEEPGKFHDQKVNIAIKETVTLPLLLKLIGECLNISNIEYDYDENTAWFRYPTAQRGPIDITKAELLFNWAPTNLKQSVMNTCRFFEDAMTNSIYAKEKEIMLAEFIEDGLPNEFDDEKLFVESLTTAYGPSVWDGIDIGFQVNDEKQIADKSKNEL